jgi:hypothetical protein
MKSKEQVKGNRYGCLRCDLELEIEICFYSKISGVGLLSMA